MSKIPFSLKVIAVGAVIVIALFLLYANTIPEKKLSVRPTSAPLMIAPGSATETPRATWTPPWSPTTSELRTPYYSAPVGHQPQNIYSPTPRTCTIKGNVNSRGERFYHCPNFPTYSRTKVDTSDGDRWFCTEAEAIAAGFVSGAKGYGCRP